MSDRTEYYRQYYAEHRDKKRERSRQYYAEHREQENERSRRWHAEHRDVANKRVRQGYYNSGGQAMSENHSCPAFLGVYVAERLLSRLFKNATRMPINNPGFDFRCGQGYMVDVKASCRHISPHGTVAWSFNIDRNDTADFFLCIAFDNRCDLNPLHYWLIPGDVLSRLVCASISETTLAKWAKYEKPLDDAIACCNTMKGAI